MEKILNKCVSKRGDIRIMSILPSGMVLNRVQYGRYETGTKIVKAFDMTLESFFIEGFDVKNLNK